MYEVRDGLWQTPGGHAVQFFYRADTNDWNTLTATLTNDEYGLPRNITGRAVDVGGYLGSVGIALALDNPGLDVTIIEPVPGNADLIERNIEANRAPARLVRGAVGGNHRPVRIRYGFTGSPALLHHAFVGNSTLAETSDESETVRYTPITLSDLTVVGDIDWLKIDTEGAEWAFLSGPVERVGTIVGEWHPGGGAIGDFAALLGPTHVVTFTGPQAGPGGFRAVRRA